MQISVAIGQRGAKLHPGAAPTGTGGEPAMGVSLELPAPSPDPPHAAAINATTARNPQHSR